MNVRLSFLLLALVISSGCFAREAGNSTRDRQVASSAHKTGNYSQRGTLVALVGEAEALRYSDVFAAGHELEFNVYVPRNYDPSTPAGLQVYVSPIASGSIPHAWREIFEQRNLVWVSVNDSGNTMPAEQRLAEATLSAAFMSRNYKIDAQRTYVSGMSGGAQIATIAATRYPELLKGGIFLCGVHPWSERDPDPWTEDPPDSLDTIKQNRYVFLSGTEDFKLAAIARAYRLYKKAGIGNSKLIVVQDMGHELPTAEDFDRALNFLDANSAVPVANSGKDPR